MYGNDDGDLTSLHYPDVVRSTTTKVSSRFFCDACGDSKSQERFGIGFVACFKCRMVVTSGNTVDGEVVSSINRGLLCLLGIAQSVSVLSWPVRSS